MALKLLIFNIILIKYKEYVNLSIFKISFKFKYNNKVKLLINIIIGTNTKLIS